MSSPATLNQTQNPEQQNRDHRQEVTDSIISLLEQGVAPWQKPWQGIGIPTNPTTDKAYRGGNAVHLMATALQRGYDDPRWMTYKQAAENDWQVKKGEKGTRIEFWEVKDPTRRQDRTAVSRRTRLRRSRSAGSSTRSTQFSMPSRSTAFRPMLRRSEHPFEAHRGR